MAPIESELFLPFCLFVPFVFIANLSLFRFVYFLFDLRQMPVSAGPTLLTRMRAATWINFKNAPVSEKQDTEQQWGAAITRLDDVGGQSDRSSEMVGMHNPIASVRGSESANMSTSATDGEARPSVYDSYSGRASWVQWDITEPTYAEEAERMQAEESGGDEARAV